MKCAVVVFLTLVALLASPTAGEEKYTNKYDNVDLDEVLGSDRLFNNYFNCLMDKGKCAPDGKTLKDTIPDALTTGCSKCSEKQKAGVEKVITFMIKNKKEQYGELEKKYDPSGIYRKKYEDKLKSITQKA